MKNVPVILVVCMLLFSSLDVLAQTNHGCSNCFPSECCFKYYTNKLPKYNVVTFRHTHHDCAKAGIVFTMKKDNMKICVDPTQKWVQDAITYVESRA